MLPYDWIPAADNAAAIVRAIHGPSATFGYSPGLPRSGVGRRYYIHVPEAQSPVRLKAYSTLQIKDLQRKHGERYEAVIAEDMCGLR